MVTAEEKAYRDVKEYDLMSQAIELATYCGWLCNHQRPAKTNAGPRTAIMGNEGFPDVVFVSRAFGMVIFAEFKRQTTKRSPAQDAWAEHLEHVSTLSDTVHYRLWRPSDWPEIQCVLNTGRFTP